MSCFSIHARNAFHQPTVSNPTDAWIDRCPGNRSIGRAPSINFSAADVLGARLRFGRAGRPRVPVGFFKFFGGGRFRTNSLSSLSVSPLCKCLLPPRQLRRPTVAPAAGGSRKDRPLLHVGSPRSVRGGRRACGWAPRAAAVGARTTPLTCITPARARSHLSIGQQGGARRRPSLDAARAARGQRRRPSTPAS